MQRKLLFGLIVCLLISSLFLAACSKTAPSTSSTTSAPAPASTSVTSPVSTSSATQANWWDKFGKPQYGGTITIPSGVMDANFDGHDPRENGSWYDGLFATDWTIEPTGAFVSSENYIGALAESWKQTDPLTITLNIRQGVKWQNKAPVNGREFTAADVEFNFDRILGTGHGFTQKNPFFGSTMDDIDHVTATDKYTVDVTLKKSTAFTIFAILNNMANMVAPEWVALAGPPTTTSAAAGGGGGGPGGPGPGGPGGGLPSGGPLTDWKSAVGTGPWILTDFVNAVSLTCSRNPDYWGYDERHPQNKIPYADSYRVLAIPDLTTELAALRTGKIDLISDPRSYPTWQQVASLKQTNPEIESAWLPADGYSLDLRVDKSPFTDIKVREALQMAIDRNSIAKNIFGGTVSGIPCGYINPVNKDWTTLYAQWPSELQQEYSYNPTKAKELLAEAGYPNGFDTNIVASSQDNLDILVAIKAEFKDIGVNMDISSMDNPVFMTYCSAGKNDQMCFFVSTGLVANPLNALQMGTSAEWRNFNHNNDATFQAMYDKFAAATDMTEAKKLCNEADMYAISQNWAVRLFGNSASAVWQNYDKGYSGQIISGPIAARMWVDQDLKKSLGR